MIFYVADTHFRDEKIFNKCNRPFANLIEYENVLINRWNSKVKNSDTVYVLGDLVLDGCVEALDVFVKLNGHKHLLIGNHDEGLLETIRQKGLFETIDFIKVMQDGDKKVCVCHYPLMDWIEFNRNGYHVYGHIHNKTIQNGVAYQQIKEYFIDKPAYNCSVDITQYEPVTLDEMIRLKEVNRNEAYIN